MRIRIHSPGWGSWKNKEEGNLSYLDFFTILGKADVSAVPEGDRLGPGVVHLEQYATRQHQVLFG